jgi:hypothetical protein
MKAPPATVRQGVTLRDFTTWRVGGPAEWFSEPVSQEDFGSFSAESILSGQNFLDPRAQIGYPETVGGTLRNANLQLRSEPVNPRDPVSIFNLSTIVPDTMRPAFEIGSV